ncbi:TetR/AcrR family transcriptional regulator [Scandinavium manionii]|uniref:TetR/AcrR family transcriptional regulator n=1 Tax=Scandinavium manionii TaxID=2926520 RepID=UPI00135A8257|nr:TetR/AcrR family transcriptional regulator [Scandinavium manionii]MCS2149988.1 TetR family transcriptional regulator [Scandinavium manionii]MCS2168323.1 TetR family transcriptional regulator [Scandinavium manionii]
MLKKAGKDEEWSVVKKTENDKNASADKQIRILQAARAEFAEKGFDGARVDSIAARAHANKQLIYYYFTNKDVLFTRVLEDAYRDIRKHEAALLLDDFPADEAILKLVEFTWQYYLKNPEFIRLLNSENQLKARHLKDSAVTVGINQSWISITKSLLERGSREGTVRPHLDVMQLNINISALGFFYLINQSTLSILYQKDLSEKAALDERLRVMKECIAAWIKP